eukprot:31359-Pelagococcus_subviridis.AAC.2
MNSATGSASRRNDAASSRLGVEGPYEATSGWRSACTTRTRSYGDQCEYERNAPQVRRGEVRDELARLIDHPDRADPSVVHQLEALDRGAVPLRGHDRVSRLSGLAGEAEAREARVLHAAERIRAALGDDRGDARRRRVVVVVRIEDGQSMAHPERVHERVRGVVLRVFGVRVLHGHFGIQNIARGRGRLFRDP